MGTGLLNPGERCGVCGSSCHASATDIFRTVSEADLRDRVDARNARHSRLKLRQLGEELVEQEKRMSNVVTRILEILNEVGP